MTDIKITKTASDEDLEKCFCIRKSVFVREQNVSEAEEIDGLDSEADHYLLWVDGKATGTARVRYLSDVAKIERVAVLNSMRGLALGQRLMEFIISDIQNNSPATLMKLGAQIHVIKFYEKLGFISYGDEFMDANISHKWMKRKI